jgi:hypothetical protein
MAAELCALNNTELVVLATIRRIEETVPVDLRGLEAIELVLKHQTELNALSAGGLIVRQPTSSSWSLTEKGIAALRAQQFRLERIIVLRRVLHSARTAARLAQESPHTVALLDGS